jgi:hypothetical protein
MPSEQTIISGHGPYEDLGIKALEVIEKVIDGQSAEQKVKLWGNWIDFWQPAVEAAIAFTKLTKPQQ